MKTTLTIDDQVMARLQEESARQRKTITEIVESGLRLMFRPPKTQKPMEKLPSFIGGIPTVNIANREVLYDLLEDT